MNTPHPNEVVKYCPHCRCKTWTDVDGVCEWAALAIAGGFIVLWLALVGGGIGYVAIHFILKFW